MRTQGSYRAHCEKRLYGTETQYRIVPGGGKKLEMIVVMQELEPILEGLEAEGRKNMATMSPGTVATLAHRLRKAIESLAK